jgi:hypothetical protein
LTLPLAILGPRHCPRCEVGGRGLVKLDPCGIDEAGAA